MTQPFVDLRSDTVTRPTPAMRKAMAEAEVGDDVYGEDPTVNRLQEVAAVLLGKEAALFVPSGTMANLIAVMTHVRHGEEVILEAGSHIYNYETGSMAAFAGALPRPVPGERGVMDPRAVAAAVRPPAYYYARTSLVCLENSHNVAGGTVMEMDALRAICQVAREHSLPVHLDGARIFNAAAALGVQAREIAGPCDSVMFCISKGLSAPAGSLLLGSRPFVERAHKKRKMLGGGMRQAGVLAAAGLVALEEVLPRLPEDHRRARTLAEALAERPFFEVDLPAVRTNIVRARVVPPRTPGDLAKAFEARGILCSPASADSLRLVLHQDIDDEGLERAVRAIADLPS